MLRKVLRIQILLLVCAELVACAGASAPSGQAAQPAPAAAGPGGLTFGSPRALLPSAVEPAYSAVPGGQFQLDPPFSYHNVERVFTSAWYQPAGGSGGSGLADLAYAMYTLGTTELSGAQPLRLTWEGELPSTIDVWVGLGNLERDTWDWFALDSAVLPIPDLAPYIDEREMLLVAIVLIGSGEAFLDWLTLGQGHPGYYEIEDNDSAAQANELPEYPFPQPYVIGSLGTTAIFPAYDGDQEDWYSFNLPVSGFVSLDVAPVLAYFTSELRAVIWRDAAGDGLVQLASASAAESFNLSAYLDQAGKYYVEVTSQDAAGDPFAGDYELGMEFGAASFYETEPNDVAADADVLPALPVPFGAVFGSVGATATPQVDQGEVVYDGSTEDWYSFTLAPAGPIEIESRSMFGVISLELYDAGGAELLAQAADDSQSQQLVALAPAAGD